MATYAPEQNPEDDIENPAPAQGPAMSATSTAPTTVGTPAPSPSPSSGAKTKSAPDRFISFDQWYGANSGAAQNLANQIGDKVQTAASGAKNDLNTIGDKFQQQVQAAGLQANPNITRSGQFGQGFTAQNASYTGPTDVTEMAGYEDARTRANTAGRQVNQLQSTEGIQALLPTQNTNPTANMFNAALAQRAGGDRFQSLWNQFSGVGDLAQTTQNNANTAVQNARNSINTRNQTAAQNAARMTESEQEQARRAEESRNRTYERNRARSREQHPDRYGGFEDYYGGGN